jgi:hypothetical protein
VFVFSLRFRSGLRRHSINLLLHLEHHIAHPSPGLFAAIVKVLLHPRFECCVLAEASLAQFDRVGKGCNAAINHGYVCLEPILSSLEKDGDSVVVHHYHGGADGAKGVDFVFDIL